MTEADALRLLGLPATASPDEVRARYRDLAKRHHPDAGGDAATFARLREAHDVALAAAEAPLVVACTACAGRGYLRRQGGFHVLGLPCDACSGTGEKTL